MALEYFFNSPRNTQKCTQKKQEEKVGWWVGGSGI
jgi:hypothetical protein